MIRDISIKPVLNGFIVKVGCQTVVYNDIGILCETLSNYLKDSELIESRYRAEALNKWMIDEPVPYGEPPSSPGQLSNRRNPVMPGPPCDISRAEAESARIVDPPTCQP